MRWVSDEEDGRREAGGGRRRKADTELKTKTPHVNVGKKFDITMVWMTPVSLHFTALSWTCPIELPPGKFHSCTHNAMMPQLKPTETKKNFNNNNINNNHGNKKTIQNIQ